MCINAKIDDRLMFNAKAAHSRYTAKNALNKASTDITLKRKLEKEVDIQYNKDARLML